MLSSTTYSLVRIFANGSQVSGDVVQSGNFYIITAYPVNGNVVLMQNQFAGTVHPPRPTHARMHLQLGHCVLQLQHKTGGSGRVMWPSNLEVQPLVQADVNAIRLHLLSLNADDRCQFSNEEIA
jgi:hypothetical protein